MRTLKSASKIHLVWTAVRARVVVVGVEVGSFVLEVV